MLARGGTAMTTVRVHSIQSTDLGLRCYFRKQGLVCLGLSFMCHFSSPLPRDVTTNHGLRDILAALAISLSHVTT